MKITSSNRYLFLLLVINLFVLFYTNEFSLKRITDRPYNDSYGPIYKAIQVDWGNQNIYEEVFFKQKCRFQYPPTSLVFFVPFRNLEYADFDFIFNSFLNRMAGILIYCFIFFLIAKTTFQSKISTLNNVFRLISLFVLAFFFYPIWSNFHLGNIQAWLNLFLILGIYFYINKKENITGILLAICTLFKPFYGFILIWMIVRKKWNIAKYFLITFSIFTLISLWIFGLENHLSYLDVASQLSKTGEVFHKNQSVNGLMNRFFFTDGNLFWTPKSFPPYHPTVYWTTTISSLLILILALIIPIFTKVKNRFLDFLIVLVSTSIASPIAWQHHFGFWLIIYFYLFQIFIKNQFKNQKYTAFLLALSFTFVSHNNRFISIIFGESKYNFLQSFIFFGGIILLFLLYNLNSKSLNTNHLAEKF